MFTTVATIVITACLAVTGLASEPAAVVNGEEITREELQATANLNQIIFGIYQQFPRFAQTLLTTEEGEALLQRYEEDVLEELIERTLQRQEAERRGITADEDEVQARVDENLELIKQQYQLTDEELEAELVEIGLTLEEFREQRAEIFREQLVQEALREEITSEVSVSEEEIIAFYENNPDEFRDEEGELLPFEEVRDTVEEELLSQAQDQAWYDWLAELRELAEITISL